MLPALAHGVLQSHAGVEELIGEAVHLPLDPFQPAVLDAQEAAMGQLLGVSGRGSCRGPSRGTSLGLGQLGGQAFPLGVGQSPVGGLQRCLALDGVAGGPGEAGRLRHGPS